MKNGQYDRGRYHHADADQLSLREHAVARARARCSKTIQRASDGGVEGEIDRQNISSRLGPRPHGPCEPNKQRKLCHRLNKLNWKDPASRVWARGVTTAAAIVRTRTIRVDRARRSASAFRSNSRPESILF